MISARRAGEARRVGRDGLDSPTAKGGKGFNKYKATILTSALPWRSIIIISRRDKQAAMAYLQKVLADPTNTPASSRSAQEAMLVSQQPNRRSRREQAGNLDRVILRWPLAFCSP